MTRTSRADEPTVSEADSDVAIAAAASSGAPVTEPPDVTPPVVEDTVPPAGSTVDELTWVEVVFDEAVTGVTAEDLLINGVPATSVNRSSSDHYLFSFPQPAPGAVRFTWASGHGIVDQAAAGNAFRGGTWTVQLDPAAALGKVRISEVMADADRAVLDDDCDGSDWIEIHNSGTSPVNLSGWALTDDANDPAKWRFPEYQLAADGYLVVFASQKNKTNLPVRVATACRTRTNALASFHTNFRLSPDGEYLGLIGPNGKAVSEFKPAYPPQRRDVSYGLVPGSVANFGYFASPTAGKPNAATGAGFAPKVTFSRPGGVFVNAFTLKLACEQPQATIRYTVDGTFPAETNRNLLTYTVPIRITSTTQVRARAWVTGLLPGEPASETYLGLTNRIGDLASFTSSLPIVVMTTLKTATIRDSVNTPVHFSLFEPRNGLTSLQDAPTLQTRGGAKTRGSSTGGQPQSNFAIEWWDEFDQDRDLGVLGMPEDSEWVLYAPNEYDAALIHNPFTMGLSQQMNFSAPRTRFVEVYLNRGGLIRSNDWFGLYVLMEKPGLSKGRIDAPKAQPEDVAFPEVTGSYMFKTDRLDPGDAGFSAGGSANCYVEPKEREMRSPQRAPQLAYLTQYFKDMDNALRAANPDLRDPVRGYRAYLEVTNWVDFHMLETLSGQVDAIRLSTYFYKRREGKVEYGPRWDYDRAWESKGDSRDDNPRIWDTGGGLFANPWWPRLFADRDAWQLWVDRWQMYRRSVFSQTNMFAFIDRLTNQIAATQPREARRWSATAPRVSYRNEIGIMKTWISNRLAWIDLQFAQPPRFSSSGGQVTSGFQLTLSPPLSVSNPTNVSIFYTLDGTDPRPPVGTNPPASILYSGPITITGNTKVTARVRDNGRVQRSGPPSTTPWSGAVTATFVVTPPALLVTEIMHHPAPPPAGSGLTDNDFEFVELKNTSGEPLELAGYRFTAGIAFAFDRGSAVTRLLPGERVVVAANPAAFASRYPGVARVVGPFDGRLADEGERLTMEGPVGEAVFDFEYVGTSVNPGPGAALVLPAQGLGFSWVLRDEGVSPGALGEPGRWQASGAFGGSPGALDVPRVGSVPAVVISEVLANPEANGDEWIELHNPGTVPADIGGWWLTDDFEDPRKARFPAGTVIAAGGYLVVRPTWYGAGATGFRLSAAGDEVWLVSADPSGGLTGYVHGFRFGASARGASFGRYRLGTEAEEFLATSMVTPGSVNAAAKLGPVIVSEVQTRSSVPRWGQSLPDEFIELRNASLETVALFDAAKPARTWRIRGDVDLDLPAGMTLAPGGLLVLVGFDPVTDVRAREAFRLRHRMSASVTLVGPWQGRFPAEVSPTIRVLRPTEPARTGANGEDAYVLVEELHPPTQAGIASWPDGGLTEGLAWVRAGASVSGRTGADWRAASPTPGADDDDQDGLPDAWEREHGLTGLSADAAGDSDGDGLRNVDEFHGGTDPLARTTGMPLRYFTEADGRMLFLVDGAPGQGFVLEAANDPAGGAWTVVREAVAPAWGPVVLDTGFPGETARFYRVGSR